jgi:meso-butanediol dehydrogenase/(S,S)-butanediol dehydrogenase/diacetyl reductase
MTSTTSPSSDNARVALVTGAAGGLGHAIALQLARDGLDLALADLPGVRGALDTLAAEVEKLGRRSCVLTADVTVEEEVEGMVRGAVEALGSVDVVRSHVHELFRARY